MAVQVWTNLAVSPVVALAAVVTVAALALANPDEAISAMRLFTSVPSPTLPVPTAILAKAVGESTPVSSLAVSTNPYLVTQSNLSFQRGPDYTIILIGCLPSSLCTFME